MTIIKDSSDCEGSGAEHQQPVQEWGGRSSGRGFGGVQVNLSNALYLVKLVHLLVLVILVLVFKIVIVLILMLGSFKVIECY